MPYPGSMRNNKSTPWRRLKNMKKVLFLTTILFIATFGIAKASTDINLTIRDGNTIVFSGTVPLQIAGTVNINDSLSNPHSIDADSVLSVLNDADISSSNFNISDLEYYNSMGSFYLKCINDSSGNECDNWQYTVNDSYPFLGIDKNILSGGENVYFYFGPEHKMTLSSNSLTAADTLTVKAENYHYQDNTWLPLTGITIGLTQPDLGNPYSPKEITTSAVDADGQATFSVIPAGSYNVGIQQDYYFPTEMLTVTAAPLPPEKSGGNNEIVVTTPKPKLVFDSEKALNFLLSKQKDNSSFGEDLYTDWTALALASNFTPKTNTDKIAKYFSENKLSGTLLTDYERRAMALMSLGLNPYSLGNENCIQKITDSFDGTQFGDKNADNDDIFALIVLQNAGYAPDEKIISSAKNFILSKQKADGSWDENVDLTGAGIESLAFLSPIPGVGESLKKAELYLKQNQKEDGGWLNVSSTAWTMEGILALGEKPEDWIINGNTPLDYLALNQDADGGIKETDVNSKIWQTAYTLTALSGKSWNQTMQKFDKPLIKMEPAPASLPAINPLLSQTISNSNQAIFLNQIKKFQKSKSITKIEKAPEVMTSSATPTPTSVKKPGFFRRLFKMIFGF